MSRDWRGSHPLIRVVGLVLGAGLGVLTAVTAWDAASTSRLEASEPYPAGDRVLAASDGLRETHVYVAPDAREELTRAEQERLSALAADGDPQLFVVVWGGTRSGGYDGAYDALDQLVRAHDEPGVYAIADGAGDFAIQRRGVDTPYTQIETGGRLADSIERLADGLHELGSEPAPVGGYELDYYGGVVGSSIAGVCLGLVVTLGLWLLTGTVRALSRWSFRAPSVGFWPTGPAARRGAR